MNTIKREGFDLRSTSGVGMEPRHESFTGRPTSHHRGRVRKFNENQISHPNKCISSTSHSCVHFSFDSSRTKSKEFDGKVPKKWFNILTESDLKTKASRRGCVGATARERGALSSLRVFYLDSRSFLQIFATRWARSRSRRREIEVEWEISSDRAMYAGENFM